MSTEPGMSEYSGQQHSSNSLAILWSVSEHSPANGNEKCKWESNYRWQSRDREQQDYMSSEEGDKIKEVCSKEDLRGPAEEGGVCHRYDCYGTVGSDSDRQTNQSMGTELNQTNETGGWQDKQYTEEEMNRSNGTLFWQSSYSKEKGLNKLSESEDWQGDHSMEKELNESNEAKHYKAFDCGSNNEPGTVDVQEWQERQIGKKKHRRGPSKKKRRWKPYFKLSWEEKQQLEEKESLRAFKVRAEMFAKGLPVAPYNTTQFLMAEHEHQEPDLKPDLPKKLAVNSYDSSDEEYLFEEEDSLSSDGVSGNGVEFHQKDFFETFEKYHAERLENMTKQELIREHLELERSLSKLEEENNRLRYRLECKLLGKSGDLGGYQERRSRNVDVKH
ncbi:protein HEXIM1 [Protopterus annectens]|uniref:protein HEXIM1 n=1 Tax=Protopterus annectens TaxID=7888 RepID=UPI001CFB450E|nr:protein HEXIM1 [Protopterus annectens]